MNRLPAFDADTYAAELAKLLSAWKPTIKAELVPHPVHVRISGGGEAAYEYNQYTIVVNVISPLSDKTVGLHLIRKENEFDFNEQSLWRDAYEVQDEYYGQLKLPRGDVSSSAPYWQLWDESKKIT